MDIVSKLAKQSETSRHLILNSIIQTPCFPSRLILNEGIDLYFKAENFQITGSFKIRGALSKIKKITKNTKNGAMIIFFYHIEEKLEGVVVFFLITKLKIGLRTLNL